MGCGNSSASKAQAAQPHVTGVILDDDVDGTMLEGQVLLDRTSWKPLLHSQYFIINVIKVTSHELAPSREFTFDSDTSSLISIQ